MARDSKEMQQPGDDRRQQGKAVSGRAGPRAIDPFRGPALQQCRSGVNYIAHTLGIHSAYTRHTRWTSPRLRQRKRSSRARVGQFNRSRAERSGNGGRGERLLIGACDEHACGKREHDESKDWIGRENSQVEGLKASECVISSPLHLPSRSLYSAGLEPCVMVTKGAQGILSHNLTRQSSPGAIGRRPSANSPNPHNNNRTLHVLTG
ncbi:hypothetical protein K437DRAFT_117737 [Tilletiaria anomala UBC 951]|uniref:Uncharacterized protein n=1 Tax=Tilletiaria anomala (strain ATCC 24038 / CBS 436.72 / UBC 951) TaxID=1037660 RepID=A0A066WKQ7_TILAU|nr:uncharacterized protein K437DRAFT_117737 [Tilletiaria anomala UBC 951]KDN53163.1 hypothetical protein K437DRAFT_117737 [Tilletiaria anomala UBC 951]